ncbi:MAG TPA: thiamine phosphate synthase, partial [Nitrospirae bacterium]|nr:thiamine phosphate synthase [Nitrospirota bacterium]
MYLGGICFITDRMLSNLSVEDSVKKVLDAGVKFIQYREKTLSRRDIYFQAGILRKRTEEYNATFVVNDHCD